jgi:hypothetical protein
MRAIALTVSVAMVATAAVRGDGQAAVDLLGAARQALGGDAALTAVKSFTVGGSLARDLGRFGNTSDLEISCELPDRFVRMTHRRVDMGPMGSGDITEFRGFNGDDPIQETIAPDSPVPPVIHAGPAPTTPAEIAAERQRRATVNKRIFVELALPLFGASFGGFPLDFRPAGRVPLATGPADEIDARGPDGSTWFLFLDASTHLPVKLTWRAKPIVTFSTSSIVTTTSSGQVVSSSPSTPVVLPSDPTAGMAMVEWAMTIDDYKTADGLNWPHRFTTTVDGKKYEELRLKQFRLNPKIDAKRFKPSK